jgi:hypothetical protein
MQPKPLTKPGRYPIGSNIFESVNDERTEQRYRSYPMKKEQQTEIVTYLP